MGGRRGRERELCVCLSGSGNLYANGSSEACRVTGEVWGLDSRPGPRGGGLLDSRSPPLGPGYEIH